MSLPQQSQVTDWIGKRVVDPDGADLGSCSKLFADNDTGLVEWAGVEPEAGSGDGRERIVPLVGAREEGGSIRVSVARDEVVASPTMSGADRLTEEEEAGLYRHYGIPASKEGSDSLLPAGEGDTASDAETGGTADAANAYGAPSTTAVPGTVQDDLAGTRETGSAPATGGPVARSGGSAPLGRDTATTAPATATPGATSGSGGGVQSNVRQGGSSGSGSGSSNLVPAAAAGAALLVGATVFVLRRRQAAPPTPAERVGAGVRPLLHDAQVVASRGLLDAATTAAETRAKVKALAATAAPVVAGTGALAAERARHGAELAGSTARGAARSGRELGQRGAKSGNDLGKTAAATAAGLGATLAREGAHLGHALSEAGHSVAETAGTAAERVAGTATAAGAAAVAAPARLAHAVVEAADEFEDDVERAWRKTARRVLFVLGLGTGYVFGARDGRERYDEIVAQAQRVTGL